MQDMKGCQRFLASLPSGGNIWDFLVLSLFCESIEHKANYGKA